MPMYEVLEGYWKGPLYVTVVTDDVWFARSELLRRLEYSAGSLTKQQFAEFETKFSDWSVGKTTYRTSDGTPHQLPLFFSVRDYHTELRVAQQRVAVGGMSTLPA